MDDKAQSETENGYLAGIFPETVDYGLQRKSEGAADMTHVRVARMWVEEVEDPVLTFMKSRLLAVKLFQVIRSQCQKNISTWH